METNSSNTAATPLSKKVGIGAALVAVPAVAAYEIYHHAQAKAATPARGMRQTLSYDSPNLRKVDPALVAYKEIKRIDTNLTLPKAIALDAKGNIVVAGNKTLRVFSSEGTQLSDLPLPGPSTALAIAADGNYLVAVKDHVITLTPRGETVADWKFGAVSHITSIAITGDDIYFADAGERIVLRYDHAGKLKNRIAARDPEKNQSGLVVPSPHLDVAVDINGLVWVANPGVHRLEAYTPDGTLERFWGSPGPAIDGFFGCCNPANFTLFSDGRFVTAEKSLARVKVYSSDGHLQSVVATPGDLGENPMGVDVAIDPAGHVYLLDPLTKTIRVFGEKK